MKDFSLLGNLFSLCINVAQFKGAALGAEIGDWKSFTSARNLAAWVGLVPRQHTTGGNDRLGSITKQGNRWSRRLLVVGAMALIRHAQETRNEEPAVARPGD
jgi:transposase